MAISMFTSDTATPFRAIDDGVVDSDASDTCAPDATFTPSTYSTTGHSTPIEAESKPLPYWLVNVPEERWPTTCPEWLRDVSEKNKRVLSTPDEMFKRQDWDAAIRLIKSNRIGEFQRLPSDLRKYLEYMSRIKEKFGSVHNFMLKERLHWDEDDLQPRGKAFEYEEDYKILYNDWPYGVEKGIVHLVIWAKCDLEEDPTTGDITDATRKAIDDFIESKFRSHIPADRVLWFKNWKSLKSVHTLEHLHVMLNNPDKEFIRRITNGDVPLIEKI